MRKVHVLFYVLLSAILFAGSFSVYAQDKIVLKRGQSLAVCKTIAKVLRETENIDYLSLTANKAYPSDLDLFFIPERYKDLKKVEWSLSSEQDFKSFVPEAYNNLAAYAKRENAPIIRVDKTEVDSFNRKVINTIYRAKTADGYIWNSVVPLSNDLANQYFNDAAGIDAFFFYYKNSVLVAEIPSQTVLNIKKFHSKVYRSDGIICQFNAVKN